MLKHKINIWNTPSVLITSSLKQIRTSKTIHQKADNSGSFPSFGVLEILNMANDLEWPIKVRKYDMHINRKEYEKEKASEKRKYQSFSPGNPEARIQHRITVWLCVGAGEWWWIFCHKTGYNVTTLNQTQTKIVKFLFQEIDININRLCYYTVNRPKKDLTTLQYANYAKNILSLQDQTKDDFSLR